MDKILILELGAAAEFPTVRTLTENLLATNSNTMYVLLNRYNLFEKNAEN